MKITPGAVLVNLKNWNWKAYVLIAFIFFKSVICLDLFKCSL